jgi:hypothetical protein
LVFAFVIEFAVFALLLLSTLTVQSPPRLQQPGCSVLRADSALLARLLPPTAVWSAWAAAVTDSNCGGCGGEDIKAPVLLLVAQPGARVAKEALEDRLLVAFPGCGSPARCFDSLDLASLATVPQPRAMLQRALVRLLRRHCLGPQQRGPLLALHGLQLLPTPAVAALLPLLSEYGSYEAADGGSIPAHRATVILVAELELGEAFAAGEREFDVAAKAELQRLFTLPDGPEELGRALRRRIDYVAPLYLV